MASVAETTVHARPAGTPELTRGWMDSDTRLAEMAARVALQLHGSLRHLLGFLYSSVTDSVTNIHLLVCNWAILQPVGYDCIYPLRRQGLPGLAGGWPPALAQRQQGVGWDGETVAPYYCSRRHALAMRGTPGAGLL